MHLPAVWDATHANALLWLAADVATVASALLFWWPALAPASPLGPLGRAGYLMVGMPVMSAVGVVLDFVDRPLYARRVARRAAPRGRADVGRRLRRGRRHLRRRRLAEPRARGTARGRGGAMRLVLVLVVGLVLAAPAQGATGRELFREGCSSCHGLNGDGVPQRGPSLHGVGAAAADFYLSTGRMPLVTPGAGAGALTSRSTPTRTSTRSSRTSRPSAAARRCRAPTRPRATSAQGQRIFTESCSGCHQIEARGGVVTGGFSPSLQSASTRQIYEAVRIGPWVMPAFDRAQLSDRAARLRREVRALDAPPGRSRRLGHLEHRPGARGHGDVAARRRLAARRGADHRQGATDGEVDRLAARAAARPREAHAAR